MQLEVFDTQIFISDFCAYNYIVALTLLYITVCHEELGDEVHIPVTTFPHRLRRGTRQAEALVQLRMKGEHFKTLCYINKQN